MNDTAPRSVRVKLFAGARHLAGTDELAVELPVGGTIADLRAALAALQPDLEPLLRRGLFAIACEFATDSTVVPSQGEVALIPPVSGG